MSRGKAVALLSGGLDSRLAVKMMLDQDIEVEAINFVTPFCTCTAQGCQSEARSAAAQLGIPLRVVNSSEALLAAVKQPKFGYGRALNPCLDCRVLSFRRAAERMEETGATFLVTGEVLGQRPMSQRREAIRLIEREAGLQGKVLRPLSAKHFQPTEPERDGLVDRDQLLAFAGRSRKPQMELAAEMGINDYPCPAGGCLLTDPQFGARLKELLERFPDCIMPQVTLMKAGRHFISSDDEWIIVPRDDLDNRRLLNLKHALSAIVESEAVGPVAGVMSGGRPSGITLAEAADLVARYGKGRDSESVAVVATDPLGQSWRQEMSASPTRGRRLADELRRL
jgi:tRNA-uridine 2-sulfurtransferase